MEPTNPNGGSKRSIMKSAPAQLHMNGMATPAWKLTSQLENAALNTTNQKRCIGLAIVVIRSIGKSLMGTARMLKIDSKWIRI